MIYRFRVILDAAHDVLRDIEMEGDSTLEDLHNVLVQSFSLPGDEMASFYTSDEEWRQGEEIMLHDMESGQGKKVMSRVQIKEVLNGDPARLIYVYDFLNMWTFMMEVADTASPTSGESYPRVIFSMGELPDSPPEKNFEADPELSEPLDEDPDDYDPYEDY